MSDPVHRPDHYMLENGLEVIDVIRAAQTPEQHLGYLQGNVLKYLLRWQHKGGIEDLYKGQQYLAWAIEQAEDIEAQASTLAQGLGAEPCPSAGKEDNTWQAALARACTPEELDRLHEALDQDVAAQSPGGTD